MKTAFIFFTIIALPLISVAQTMDRCETEEERQSQYCQSQNLRQRQQGSLRASSVATGCLQLFGQPTRTTQTTTETVNGQQQQRQQVVEVDRVERGPASAGDFVWTTMTEPPTAGAVAPLPAVVLDPERVINCRSLQFTAAGTGASRLDATANQPSMDGRIECKQVAGYTADYRSCLNALNMYNNVKIAESALFTLQAVQAQNNQQNVQNQTAQRVAAGDGQNAAYDAQISQAATASQLNQQKAAAYAAAVAALSSTVASWIKDDEATVVNRLCSGNQGRLGNSQIFNEAQVAARTGPQGQLVKFADPNAISAPRCQDAVKHAYAAVHDEMFANDQAKAAFKAAIFELVAKGIQAGIAANRLGNIAKQVEQAKKSTEDPYNPSQFEYCTVSPNDPRCAGQSTRTPGSGITDGGFSFGDSFGNNAVGGLGDEEKLGNGPLDPLNPGDAVADVNNPFSDDAKKASGILDPAAAASIQPGAAGGGSGGGGAPGLGGGSASLGNDVPGVDESKKENDIKANKADGKYSDAAGAGGFQAIKPLKEDNPFANLFGGQGGGKLEEDRSIASGDIDGQDSGLFSKISKRYGQVQADKRIEAKNLEE